MEIIEFDSVDIIKEHASLWNTLSNQVRRRFGEVLWVWRDHNEGTFRQISTGLFFDCELDEHTSELRFWSAK